MQKYKMVNLKQQNCAYMYNNKLYQQQSTNNLYKIFYQQIFVEK